LSGSIVGTPQYMSPEQAAGQRRAITTATDVYGLGAIFYAALTGRPPFQGDSVVETLEWVRERMPIAPSKLNRRVPRGQEVICLRCLDKDAKRRYDSAAALAEDLERYLRGEPILARRTGIPVRVLKWARRRPAIAALVVLVLLLAAAGVFGVAWQWRRAELHLKAALHQRSRAEQNARKQVEANRALQLANDAERTARRRAQERFDAAMKALKRFEVITKHADLLREPHFEGLRAELLQTALGFYRELQASLEEDASPEAR